MPSFNARLLSTLAGTALALSLGMPARADDTEIFLQQPANAPQANILLIVDTSGSMNEAVESTLLPYDPATTYSNSGANCSDDRLYYSTTSTTPASCSDLTSITLSGNFSASSPQEMKCKRAVDALAWGTGQTGAGFYSDRFARWRGSGSARTWQSSLANGGNTSSDIECAQDAGDHGPDAASSAKWPQQGTANQSGGRWTSTATSSWWALAANTGLAATIYSPNYVRYLRNGPRDTRTRMDVVKAAAANFLNSLPNLNVGVMRYSANLSNTSGGYPSQDDAARGGMVISPVSPLDPKRTALIADFTTSNKFEPFGWTPLSETFFEAYRYFSGGAPEFGDESKACTQITNPDANASGTCNTPIGTYLVDRHSDPASISGANYISPATESCQKNYIVYLTDGLPTQDNEADSLITGLPDFATLGGACDASGAGRCLGALAQYMANESTDLRSTVDGNQNVITHFIGFGDDFSGSGLGSAFAYLQAAATRGRGNAYQANDLASLSSVFNTIITDILATSTTFTAPTVSVNAFNRTQTLDDLYVSVFKPNTSRHWPGNLKKYAARTVTATDGTKTTVLMDNSSPPAPAVNATTGFFKDDSKSFWSATTDGALVEEGGAAKRLLDPSTRNVYTYIGADIPTASVLLSASPISTSNTSLNDATFGVGGSGDPSKDDLINWVRGVDIQNEDGDATTTVRGSMGDPIHSPPAVVTYDFTINATTKKPENFDSVVFVTTNDGFLHAFDTDNGDEVWSFIPQELLTNLKQLYIDSPTTAKAYTLDGEIRVLKFDVDGDGTVDTPNDRVILFFGVGRGGSRYYAIDVTNKSAPKYLWSISTSQLTGVGQTWSPPAIARVNVSGATQNSQKLVLIVGGGYDTASEDGALFTAAGDTMGNHIYMIDALKGTVLWKASPSGADLNNSRMTHSFPGGIAVLDTNTDGFADRMYAGDMAAQLWRFDITNGSPRASLVAGGVIASLGTKDISPATAEDSRRFYSQPDVSLLKRIGEPLMYNIALGSGYRGHPLNTAVHDRFYSIRDTQPFTPLAQTAYDSYDIISEADLQDVTDPVVTGMLDTDARGWMITLDLPSWRGEKSLSPSTTFTNVIQFTTYTPPTTAVSVITCEATSTGTNRVYTVDAFNGAPIRQPTPTDTDGDGDIDEDDDNGSNPEDRYQDLAQGGIAPQVSYLFPEADTVVCLAGVEVLSTCTNFNSRIRTYWRESNAQ